jgi:hypothetical protein
MGKLAKGLAPGLLTVGARGGVWCATEPDRAVFLTAELAARIGVPRSAGSGGLRRWIPLASRVETLRGSLVAVLPRLASERHPGARYRPRHVRCAHVFSGW